MSDEELERLLPTGVNENVARALPRPLLIRAFIDALSEVRTPDDLAASTGLPRTRAAEIVNLRDLLTSCSFVTRQ